MGAIALGLGVVLLAIGAASHVSIIVIGGLVAGAWGIWRLVTASGTKPPGGNPPGGNLTGGNPPGANLPGGNPPGAKPPGAN